MDPMKFCILNFVYEKEVAVATTVWMIEEGICSWPSVKDPGPLAKKRIKPGSAGCLWERFAVTVVGNNFYGKF
jgi:hypothetical protein